MNEFDPKQLERLVTEMAKISVAIAGLLRQSEEVKAQEVVEKVSGPDLTKAAVKEAQEVFAPRKEDVEIQKLPDSFPVLDLPQLEKAPGDVTEISSIPAPEAPLPDLPQVAPAPLQVNGPPPQDVGMPVVETLPIPDLKGIETVLPALKAISQDQTIGESQPLPEFKSSSAEHVQLPFEPLNAPPLQEQAPELKAPDVADISLPDPSEAPITQTPAVRLDPTTISSHWEHDLFSDAVQVLGDYKDESRRWRKNLLTILEQIVQDLRVDNCHLESILRHFELSRRSP